jgi:hypothetical protein
MTAYKNIFFIPILLINFLTTSIGYSADIKKQFYFIGAGGDPDGKTTIFDDDISSVGSFTNKSDWDTTISFNGGHAKTEEALKSKMSKAHNVGPFIEKNYNALMDEVIGKLKSGELKSGDQLMISIDSHGAKRSTGDQAEKTHRVSLSNSSAVELTNLTGASTVNLDKLETIIQLASDNHVKLAITDFSCFSGNLLNIKNDNVCLISASGPDQFSYGSSVVNLGFTKIYIANTFAGKFFNSLKKGKNLEELFISARAQSGDAPDFPMISTNEGSAVNDLIYKLLSPYLNYDNESSRFFDNQYERTGDKFKEQLCKIDLNHQELLNLLKQYENIKFVMDKMNSNEFKTLRIALENYRTYQKNYESTLRGKFEVEPEIQSIFVNKFPNDKKFWSRYNPLDFLTLDFDASIRSYQKRVENDKNNKMMVATWNSVILEIKRQKKIAEYVKDNLSDVAKLKLKAQNKAYAQSNVTKDLASKISLEAKKVYDTLYKSYKKPESNPCRDFVL